MRQETPATGFGGILRLLRRSGDLTGKELAPLLGISQSYLSEMESGRKEPSLRILRKYEKIFGIPLGKIALLEERLRGIGTSPAQKIRIFVAIVHQSD